MADWGAHHVDVAHWFMNADTKIPLKTAATGAFLAVPDADPEQVPDTFSISWLYDKFILTFANGEVPRAQDDLEGWGVFFVAAARNAAGQPHGLGGAAAVPRTIRKQGPPPPPTAGGMTLGAPPPAAGAPGAGRGRSGRGPVAVAAGAEDVEAAVGRPGSAAGRVQGGYLNPKGRRRRGLPARRARPELPSNA